MTESKCCGKCAAPAPAAERLSRFVQIGDTTTPANRLATLIVQALGDKHPAMDDLAAVLLAAAPAAPAEPVNARLLRLLGALIDEIDGLTGESGGVYGLHLNGDPSPWEELLPGGRFERLSSLDEARAAIAAAEAQPRVEPLTDEQRESVAALLGCFVNRIETAKTNGDGYDDGYLKAMKVRFEELVASLGIGATGEKEGT